MKSFFFFFVEFTWSWTSNINFPLALIQDRPIYSVFFFTLCPSWKYQKRKSCIEFRNENIVDEREMQTKPSSYESVFIFETFLSWNNVPMLSQLTFKLWTVIYGMKFEFLSKNVRNFKLVKLGSKPLKWWIIFFFLVKGNSNF